jgi:hypothetical protein
MLPYMRAVMAESPARSSEKAFTFGVDREGTSER